MYIKQVRKVLVRLSYAYFLTIVRTRTTEYHLYPALISHMREMMLNTLPGKLRGDIEEHSGKTRA
jgi:hypothetical protein